LITTERTFDVARPVDEVVNYVKDFRHATEWDPGTVSCTQASAGPVGIGTTWHNVSKIKGYRAELSYELTRLEPGRVTLVGKNKGSTSTDDIRVVDAGQGTSRITYRSEIEFRGIARLAEPFLRREFDRLGDETRDQMTAAIAAR
jgi:carbon monoxide dehydrogenase subunit G